MTEILGVQAGLGASSGPPRSSLSSLFGEPGPAGLPGPSPGPPLPVPSKAHSAIFLPVSTHHWLRGGTADICIEFG